jgi:hypothetical protein
MTARMEILLNDGWSMVAADGAHAVDGFSLPKYALEALTDAGQVPDPLHG